MCAAGAARASASTLRVQHSTGATRASARCCMLMLPVTLGLGLINFDLLINSTLGSLVSDQAPRAIDARVPHLHAARRACSASRSRRCCSRRSAGSPRAATRRAARARSATGMRQIVLLLIPAAAATLVLADADHAARLPARRVRRRVHAPRLDGAVLVLLQPAVRGRQPAADAHVLQPPAAVDADRLARGSTWSSTSSCRSRSTSRSGSRASSSARRSPARR